jgi:hypothetical protein
MLVGQIAEDYTILQSLPLAMEVVFNAKALLLTTST